MKNKIYKLFKTKNKNILCIYFTAGFPTINSTTEIIRILQNINNVDLIEIGIPYSDPLADGIIIQNSNYISLKNGMNISLLFSQIEKIKNTLDKPIILMGYFNQFYKFGCEKFLKKCHDINISGLIFPDLPIDIFIKKYQIMFKKYSVSMIFLITPQTDISRISMISNITDSFLYLVSSNSTTGNSISFGEEQISFFKKINHISSSVKKVPKLIGFGINNKKTYYLSCKYANGCIIGSSFIKSIKYNKLKESIENYIKSIVF
ncbi:tryptophan synthase subunit alpha [Blattabacterium cuenoti]|uniref:tryptophan synthase subunit alpha n=1 Tax=Blattabacterium cuenoti TaxID=1653831 RepID=UPI00163BE6DF|nr:tryptophan synthase subunit alpha [Blattabacterium cuenoti]